MGEAKDICTLLQQNRSKVRHLGVWCAQELFIFADGTHSYATPGSAAAMRAANDGRIVQMGGSDAPDDRISIASSHIDIGYGTVEIAWEWRRCLLLSQTAPTLMATSMIIQIPALYRYRP